MQTKKLVYPLLIVVSMLFLTMGCEALFTTSPVSFLRRNPDNYTSSQKLEYFTDLAAGGEVSEDALTDLSEFAAANADDPEINKLAGNAYIEASGIDTALESMVQEITSGGSIENASIMTALIPAEGESLTQESIEAAFEGIGVNVDTFTTGAEFLATAETNGADLSETDYMIGGIGLALDAVDDVESLEEEDKQELEQALEEAGSFDTLVEQVESGTVELEETQVALINQVNQAQEFLTEGFGAIQSGIDLGGGEGESEGEGEGEGEAEVPEEVELPEGLDVSDLFAQLLQADL